MGNTLLISYKRITDKKKKEKGKGEQEMGKRGSYNILVEKVKSMVSF